MRHPDRSDTVGCKSAGSDGCHLISQLHFGQMVALECSLSDRSEVRCLREIKICKTVVNECIVTDSLQIFRQLYCLNSFICVVIIFAYIYIGHVNGKCIIADTGYPLADHVYVRKYKIFVVDKLDPS